ncbi:hypothetical protein N7451_005476, partial [Penicillium sp. IBT 35674x]
SLISGPRKPYPTPLVIQPAEEPTHTIIALHGRGGNAERFGHELLASANVRARLPTVRFVFPTASKRRSKILKRTPINQCFHNYSFDDHCAASIFAILGGWAEDNEAKGTRRFRWDERLREILRCDANISPASENHEEMKSEDDSNTDDDTANESDEESGAPAGIYSEPSLVDDPFKQRSP